MKLEYIVVYGNSSDEFDISVGMHVFHINKIQHHRIKVKVTVGLQNFPNLPQYKLSGSITQL